MGQVVFINGAFGVGKSTVARAIARTDGRFRVFDPERLGYVLRRLPGFLPWSTRRWEDYRDAPIWRSLCARRLSARAAGSRRVVLVPMCFTEFRHLEEITARLAADAHTVRTLCLLAEADTLIARLVSRGVAPDSPEARWVYPRARAAADAHRRGDYGMPIPTEGLGVAEVASAVRTAIFSDRP